MPALLVGGGDAVHPAEISNLYAESLVDLTLAPPGDDITAAIRSFVTNVIAP